MDNKQSDKIPGIVLIFPKNFPDEAIHQEANIFLSNNIDLEILKYGNEAYNGFEWIIPTAFGAYILKPYFDSFLSQAGKDHYDILKAGLKKIIEKGKTYKMSAIAANQSIEKLSKTYTQSLSISMEFQTIDNRRIKLLFDNELDLNDWSNAVEQFVELISENYKEYPNDRLTIEIKKLNTKPHRIIYSLINTETKKLEFRDDLKMLEKYK
ncbi:MAG: hypothetical protein ABIN67_24960 [Ferruginibacter sp.]